MKPVKFRYAQQVQPLNGQITHEFPNGLLLESWRPWSLADQSQFPQADRQACGDSLVVNRIDGSVFIVPLDEMPGL